MSEHQSQLAPADNKFHVGNGDDGKHYWLTPPALWEQLNLEFGFDFDPCPFPLPAGFDGLTCEWGKSSYVNPPFGSIVHQGKKKGMTAWVRKALAEQAKGKRVVMVYPLDKWILMLLGAGAKVRNLGDVRWLATEDGSAGKGTGRHIACFILEPAFQSDEEHACHTTRPVASDFQGEFMNASPRCFACDSPWTLCECPSDLGDKLTPERLAKMQPDEVMDRLCRIRGALINGIPDGNAELWVDNFAMVCSAFNIHTQAMVKKARKA